MSDSVQVTILCEDLQTRSFIRQFLLMRGYNRHELRYAPVPGHTGGAGDKWVREQFPVELQAYHNRKHRAATCLIVAIDADIKTIIDRIKWLQEACIEQKIPFRSQDDHVLMIVPKRNIETWLAYLRGEDVDEEREQSYPRYDIESQCKGDAATLWEMCRQGRLRPTPPSSLEHACMEAQRLPK